MTKEEAKEYLKRYHGYPLFTKVHVIKLSTEKIQSTNITPEGETILETYTIAELKEIANEPN